MLNLAWRNIWRKKWRSGFTLVAVALVVYLSIINFGISTAMKNGVFTVITESSGHLQIRAEDYRDKREFADLLVRDAGELEASLTTELEDSRYVKVLEVGALLEGDNQRSRGIQLIGIEQDATMREKFIEDNLIEGNFPESDDVESIALGTKLADALKVGIGDRVYAYTFDTEGYGASAYDVVGILKIAGSEALAYTSLLAAQELAAPDAVTRLEVHLPDLRTLEDEVQIPIAKDVAVNSIGTNNSIETWSEANPGMRSYLALFDPINLVVTLIFFILAGLVVTNTIYLSVIERVREFGVMMAVGLDRKKVFGMVLAESLFLCTVGSILGGIAGWLTIRKLSEGWVFPGMGETFENAGFPSVLYPTLSTNDVIFTIVFVILTGVVAAILPAVTAGKLEPVEAMRFTA